MQAGSCLGVTWGFTLAALGGGGLILYLWWGGSSPNLDFRLLSSCEGGASL